MEPEITLGMKESDGNRNNMNGNMGNREDKEKEKEIKENKEDKEDKEGKENKNKEKHIEDIEAMQEEIAKLKIELEAKAKELEAKTRELEEKTKLANEYYTQLRYLMADIENLKKFTAKEKMDYIKFANEELVKKLLPVLDSFESALKAAGDLKRVKECEGIIEGMEKIYHQLYETLEKEGLQVISSVGEKFDPFKHEAIAQIENKNTEENTILEELQKGYIFNSKVIRASKVKVSKR
ncbi:MAG: nucleotide exchange factor GrpE [Methanocellales archaeon]